jgi:hypothetical protein
MLGGASFVAFRKDFGSINDRWFALLVASLRSDPYNDPKALLEYL